MSLKQFIEPIQVAGNPISGGYKAYKMDGTDKNNDMRKMVDFGTCHCCDYFLSKDDSIILIEETQLSKRVESIRKKIRKRYPSLNDTDENKLAQDHLRERMQLKVYGAMLILCRLTTNCASAKQLVQNKKYHFWLVASGVDSVEGAKFFENIEDKLLKELRGLLGKTLLEDVKVLPSNLLEKELSGNAPTP